MVKKILIVGTNLDCGGKEKSLISLLQSIDLKKYKVSLLLTDSNKTKQMFMKYVPEDIEIKYFPEEYDWIFIPKNNILSAFRKSLGYNLNFSALLYFTAKGIISKNMVIARQQLWKNCSGRIPDIQGHYYVAIDYTGGHKNLILDKVNANKKITWIHSDYKVYKRDKIIDLKEYECLDAIITVSKTCNDIFISEFPQLADKSYIMHNISNKKQIIKMSNEDVDFDNDFTGVKILDITRLDPNKGLDIAIKSCRALLEQGYNIKWYILGDGPERFKLETLIKQNKLEDNFILLGLKDNPYPFIKEADMIVHCSLFEGRSVSIDEAMLLAKPIILTNYPTAKDQIINGENGFICNADVEGVCEAVKYLIENKSIMEQLSHALNDFDISIKNSIEVLEQVMK